jgi:hypothetical protein
MIGFNSTLDNNPFIEYGYCQPNSSSLYNPTLVGYLGTSPNIWTPLNTFTDANFNTHITEYSMWQTTLFSNGTTFRYQKNIVWPAPQYYCFPSVGASLDNYYCTAIRMSMISWSSEQSRSGLLTLVGIIGGLAGILYHLAFWSLLLFRRIYSRFSPMPILPCSQPSKYISQTEIT